MKKLLIVLAVILTIAAAGIGLLSYANRPLSLAAGNTSIEDYLKKTLDENESLSSLLLTIHSPKTGYHQRFAVGTKSHTDAKPATAASRYHSASIGKTFCATIFGLLKEEGGLTYDDPISTWLDDEILKGLFVVDGADYSNQVTIRHLLSHTSGAGDYFEDPVDSGRTFLEEIVYDPDRTYTPEALIAFTRDRQMPAGRPGQQFHYSDTGYILLGLILESIEGKPYAEILEERIFEPLGMRDSDLMFFGGQEKEMLGVYIDGIDFSDKKALSMDWSGGGIVTTMDDLLKFMTALETGELLSEDTYEQMKDFRYAYDKGITYGMGMMCFDFSELSVLLGSMPDMYGGVGATGTYMLYDQVSDTYFIANYGALGFSQKSIEDLVDLRMLYDRILQQ